MPDDEPGIPTPFPASPSWVRPRQPVFSWPQPRKRPLRTILDLVWVVVVVIGGESVWRSYGVALGLVTYVGLVAVRFGVMWVWSNRQRHT